MRHFLFRFDPTIKGVRGVGSAGNRATYELLHPYNATEVWPSSSTLFPQIAVWPRECHQIGVSSNKGLKSVSSNVIYSGDESRGMGGRPHATAYKFIHKDCTKGIHDISVL